MPPLLERLGVELPVVQAGMGGGLSRHELAAAVSEAGGLGTIAVSGATAIRRELAAARALTGRPLAVNVLLPFARRDWFEAAAEADVVVTFWGKPRRRTPGVWLHQCGSVGGGARGAGGGRRRRHRPGGRGGRSRPRHRPRRCELLEQVRAALPAGYPLLLAGGIAEAGDVRAALEAGASAAVAGTRFLLSEESRAHALYKERLLAADETLLTDLFGAGWPAPHRVVPNAATERWLGGVRPLLPRRTNKGRTPGGFSRSDRQSRPQPPDGARGALHAAVPAAADDAGAAARTAASSPRPGRPTTGRRRWSTPARSTRGETVARIDEVRPAAEIVRELAG